MIITSNFIKMIVFNLTINKMQCELLNISYPLDSNWKMLILNKELDDENRNLLLLLRGDFTYEKQKVILSNYYNMVGSLELLHHNNKKEELVREVDKKIKKLHNELDKKNLLLRELNHRTKNNMQFIISILKLEEDETPYGKLHSIYNKLSAMSYLNELLEDDRTEINALAYFERLSEGILASYESKIEITFDITADLEEEDALLCGLILNELITNSIKHAFPSGKGSIQVFLYKIKDIFTLSINDNGVGYSVKEQKDTKGLILIIELAKSLKGIIQVDSNNGVNVTISWLNEKN